jgi:CheY-like chemotaxis protein
VFRILFVDDEPENVEVVCNTVREALGADVVLATTVEEATAALAGEPFDLVIADLFLPMGARPRGPLGPRAVHYEEHLEHLGGAVLLDELARLDPTPRILVHTACIDPEIIDLVDDQVYARVPKPAPVDTLLRHVIEALDLPVPG